MHSLALDSWSNEPPLLHILAAPGMGLHAYRQRLAAVEELYSRGESAKVEHLFPLHHVSCISLRCLKSLEGFARIQ